MISTHTPLAGRDSIAENLSIAGNLFLLTRPSRGVTITAKMEHLLYLISTHTPLAGRDPCEK